MNKRRVKKSNVEKLSDRVKKMLDLGLWSYHIQVPDDQALERLHVMERDIVKRKKEIHLPETHKNQIYRQVESQYKQQSKKKRAEMKKQTLESKVLNREKWNIYKHENFVHLGEGVSNWLNLKDEDAEKLKSNELPTMPNAKALAKLLNISIPKIKFLAYHRKSAQINHYIDFFIPKKNGNKRLISKPKSDLEEIQKIIKAQILDKLVFSDAVFGFITGKSHIDNAQEHLRRDLIINVDIEEFFPSTIFVKIRSIFRKLGYTGEISTVLALLTTKQDFRKISVNNKSFYSFSNIRYLPQGATTSPQLSNLSLTKVDQQLINRSIELGYKYTRYVDDLTFSTTKPISNISQLLYMIRKTLEKHGYRANSRKTKVIWKNNSQNVTGLIINSGKPNVPRPWRRNLRAAVHQFQYIKDHEEKEMELKRLIGCINYLRVSHPKLSQNYFELVTKYYQ